MRKNRALVIGIITLMLTLSLTACGKTSGEKSSKASSGMARDEFIGLLGDTFGYDNYVTESNIFSDVDNTNAYYSEIQASSEWGVIDKGGEFKPSERVSLGFALESAVRAIDVEDIESTGLSVGTDYAGFYSDNVAQIDTTDLTRGIDREPAEAIIKAALEYKNNLVLPQITKIELADGVKYAGPDIMIGRVEGKGEIAASSDYQVGDIVYFEPEEGEYARAIKILSIEGTEITYENVADIESVFSEIKISGTFDGKIMAVHTVSDDVSVSDGMSMYDDMKAYGMSYTDEDCSLINTANGVKSDIDKDRVVFTVAYDTKADSDTIDAEAHGNATIGIKNISVTAKYDHEFLRPWKPTKVGCTVNFDTEISTQHKGSVGKSIPLGSMDISVWGPIFVRVSLIANIGADGEISISYTTKNVFDAGWKKGTGFSKSFTSDPSMDISGHVTLTAELTARIDLRAGFASWSGSIVNAQVTSGIAALATIEGDLLDPEPICIDVLAWVPLRWGVNQESCALTKISKDFQYKQVIWDSESSPIRLHFHFEDLQRTPNDECTRGKKVVQEPIDEEGKPLDEYKEFDFEPLDFDFIRLAEYSYKLDLNGSGQVAFSEIPEGYSENDLLYTVIDGAICSVSGGTITAIEPGSTVVKISTPDGMFNAYMDVTVNDDYSTGFQGL